MGTLLWVASSIAILALGMVGIWYAGIGLYSLFYADNASQGAGSLLVLIFASGCFWMTYRVFQYQRRGKDGPR